MAKTSTSVNITVIQTKDQSVAPDVPAAGYTRIYTVGGLIYTKMPDGTVTLAGPATIVKTVLFTQVFS